MSNSCRIAAQVVFALAVGFSASAKAQDQSAEARVVAPPLSITQRYVPAARPPRSESQLRLLVDDVTPVAAVDGASVESPLLEATVVEVGPQPAINALSAGRMAITVSTSPGPAARRATLSTAGDHHE